MLDDKACHQAVFFPTSLDTCNFLPLDTCTYHLSGLKIAYLTNSNCITLLPFLVSILYHNHLFFLKIGIGQLPITVKLSEVYPSRLH